MRHRTMPIEPPRGNLLYGFKKAAATPPPGRPRLTFGPAVRPDRSRAPETASETSRHPNWRLAIGPRPRRAQEGGVGQPGLRVRAREMTSLPATRPSAARGPQLLRYGRGDYLPCVRGRSFSSRKVTTSARGWFELPLWMRGSVVSADKNDRRPNRREIPVDPTLSGTGSAPGQGSSRGYR
jgi:hypothetical protein